MPPYLCCEWSSSQKLHLRVVIQIQITSQCSRKETSTPSQFSKSKIRLIEPVAGLTYKYYSPLISSCTSPQNPLNRLLFPWTARTVGMSQVLGVDYLQSFFCLEDIVQMSVTASKVWTLWDKWYLWSSWKPESCCFSVVRLNEVECKQYRA